MRPSDHLSHSVTALLDMDADAAFAFLCDPAAFGRWALGCMDTQPSDAAHLYSGRSLLDGSVEWVEIVGHPAMLIVDFHVGDEARRTPRVSARIVRAETCDLPEGQCYLTLTAWRGAGMGEDRWHRLRVMHEAEILLIKAQCEAAARAN